MGQGQPTQSRASSSLLQGAEAEVAAGILPTALSDQENRMFRFLRFLVVFVIFFHLVAFIGEVFLWMYPSVHEFSLKRLDVPVDVGLYEQALILKTLFVNQGFYNLFVACGGIIGLWMRVNGFKERGDVLLAYMCLFAVGAGVVLLFTTRAYIPGVLQSVPALIALILMYRNQVFFLR